MCMTSLVTASKECQTGAKPCKAGKPHGADEIISFTLDECEYRISVERTSCAPCLAPVRLQFARSPVADRLWGSLSQQIIHAQPAGTMANYK
jgi:hypothetical protein